MRKRSVTNRNTVFGTARAEQFPEQQAQELAASLPIVSHRFWRFTQMGLVVLTILLVLGLFYVPQQSLSLLWNVLIPILPLTFLITPILWRNICPLATLNMLTNRLFGTRRLTGKSLPRAGAAGIVLLGIMVPARRFLFNEDGVVLAVTILIIAAAAIVLGSIFDAKAGFCNAICPVLPVEKLYGQHPLWTVKNPRCSPCSVCTAKGCIDLAPGKSVEYALGGRPAGSHAWLKTSYGIFAAAFPGFILGYFTTPDAPLASAGATYLHVFSWAAGAYLATAVVVFSFRARPAVMLLILAALAIGIYYWYAVPQTVSKLGMAPEYSVFMRSIILAFVGFWLGRALYHLKTEMN